MPETSNERLVRAETRIEEQGKIIAAVAPLVTQYAVLVERFDGLAGDLNDGLEAIRKDLAAASAAAEKQFKAIADESSESRRSRRAIYAALGLSLFGLVSNLALQLLHLGGPHT